MDAALTQWAAAHSPWSYLAAAVAVITVVMVVHRGARGLRRWDLADVITVLIALATTIYAGAGNWRFLDRAMHYGSDLRAVMVCALEGAVVVEGLRSRKNIADSGRAGADGVGLWVLAALSSVLASSASTSPQEAMGRLAIPLVAAWLWERLLAPQRRARKALRTSSPIRWRITPERILVWLRLADATDMDVSTVDAGRRVARYLRATDRAARKWRRPWSPTARADRARMRLTTHALRHGDPTAVHQRLADSAFADAMNRLGIDAGSNTTGAEGGANLAHLSTPEVPALTIDTQETAINTPVLIGVNTLATIDDATGRATSADEAERIIVHGWLNKLGVRETARIADRDPAQVSRKFARLDKDFGSLPHPVGGDAEVSLTEVNGSRR